MVGHEAGCEQLDPRRVPLFQDRCPDRIRDTLRQGDDLRMGAEGEVENAFGVGVVLAMGEHGVLGYRTGGCYRNRMSVSDWPGNRASGGGAPRIQLAPPEVRHRNLVPHVLPHDLHRHVAADLVVRRVHQQAGHARAFFEGDRGDDIRHVRFEVGRLGALANGEAVERAFPGGGGAGGDGESVGGVFGVGGVAGLGPRLLSPQAKSWIRRGFNAAVRSPGFDHGGD